MTKWSFLNFISRKLPLNLIGTRKRMASLVRLRQCGVGGILTDSGKIRCWHCGPISVSLLWQIALTLP